MSIPLLRDEEGAGWRTVKPRDSVEKVYLMDQLYEFYDTTILLAYLGAVVLTALILATVYYVYYRGRDIEEEGE